jgi:hypothetical protein
MSANRILKGRIEITVRILHDNYRIVRQYSLCKAVAGHSGCISELKDKNRVNEQILYKNYVYDVYMYTWKQYAAYKNILKQKYPLYQYVPL